MQLGGVGQRVGVDIADQMARLDIAPGPAARIFEHRESVSGRKLGDRLGLGGGRDPDRRRGRPAGAQQRPRIMRRENLPGEGDVGDVLAVGVDSRVKRQRRPREVEPLIRSEG